MTLRPLISGGLIVDVSSYQPHVDWEKLASDERVVGAYVKLTEGANYVNRLARSQAEGAHAVGLRHGYYHFARPDVSTSTDDANHFDLELAGHLAATLPPVLDLEVYGRTGSPSTVAWAREFNHIVHVARKVWPILYSYPAYLATIKPLSPIGGGLWLAAYGPNDGLLHPASPPAPWKRIRIQQYTSKGHLPGIDGPVDLSVFNY